MAEYSERFKHVCMQIGFSSEVRTEHTRSGMKKKKKEKEQARKKGVNEEKRLVNRTKLLNSEIEIEAEEKVIAGKASEMNERERERAEMLLMGNRLEKNEQKRNTLVLNASFSGQNIICSGSRQGWIEPNK